MKRFITLICLSLLPSLLFAATWTVDPVHSQVGFKVKHMVVSNVRGKFNQFQGSVDFDDASKSLKSVSASIATASIDTDNEKRDGHLKSPDFFDVAKHPQITFASTKVSQKGDEITLEGNITLRGVTKSITLVGQFLGQAKDMQGNDLIAFEAKGKINRKDFGMTWNKLVETGGFVVGDEVELIIEVEAGRNP